MKARVGIVAIVLVTAVLFTGALALATDFVWGCPGQLCSTSWTEEIDWEQGSGFPDDANDNASITSAGNLINYDPGSALTINDLTLGGTSPTKRKLNIRDAALTVNGDLTLTDYAELDLDEDLTVIGDTFLSGSIWIDLTDAVFDVSDIVIDGPATRLKVTVSGSSAITGFSLTIDAAAANEARRFKFDGGPGANISLVPGGQMTIKSDLDDDNRRAKFWLADGGVIFGTGPGGLTTIIGGNSPARRAELDLDVSWAGAMGLNALTSMTGHVSFDLADGVHAQFGRLIIGGPANVTVVAGTDAELRTN